MFMFERISAAPLVVCLTIFSVHPVRAAEESPRLGTPISEIEAASWDISVGPDGAGLPTGRGTVAQGAQIFETKCRFCHGERGQGQPFDRLAGGQGTLQTTQPAVKTVGSYWPYATTLFDYVRRAMPWTQPKSLTNDEVYAVTAYLLNINGVIGEREIMDAKTLPRVHMPNRNGFVPYRPESDEGASKCNPCESLQSCTAALAKACLSR